MRQSVGIDLSAEPKGTAIATLNWHDKHVEVIGLKQGADDGLVLHYLHHPDHTVGVDCPLGWPAPFVRLISDHANGTLRLPEHRPQGWRREFVMRQTDLIVRDRTGIVPLTVAADRIGHTAIRLAAIMSEVGDHVDTARDGSGAIVEVYPAAALKAWGLPSRGYKGNANTATLNALVDLLLRIVPWLHLGPFERACRESDDAFDAIICALVARAARAGDTFLPEDTELARQEGWIHLPRSPLPRAPWAC